MQINVCDICGTELPDREYTDELKKFMENNPKGMFNLDYRPIIVNGSGEPVGFDYQPFHMCRFCCTAINRAILNEIDRIQESVHKPSVVIPIRKFDTSPRKDGSTYIYTPICGENPDHG